MLHHSTSDGRTVQTVIPFRAQGRAVWTMRGVIIAAAVALLLLTAGILIYFVAGGDGGNDPVQMGSDSTERPEIKGDLEAVNQSGENVRLSSLRGKVWAVAEFFAVCPICSRRNSTDLRALAKRFASYPDFHLVCISIDPAEDNVKALAAYAEAFGASSERWWFLTGDHDEIHRFLEEDLRFPPVHRRRSEAEAAAFGAFLHDLGITVVDRQMRIAGKRDLAWAASQSPALKDEWERHLYRLIETELRSPAL